MSGVVVAIMAALLASGSDGDAAKATAEAKPAQADKIICVTYANTGTRIARTRVCKRKSEWDAQTDKAGQTVSEMQSRGGIAPRGLGGAGGATGGGPLGF